MRKLAKTFITYTLLLSGFMLTSTLWVYIFMVIIKKLKYAV